MPWVSAQAMAVRQAALTPGQRPMAPAAPSRAESLIAVQEFIVVLRLLVLLFRFFIATTFFARCPTTVLCTVFIVCIFNEEPLVDGRIHDPSPRPLTF